MTGRAPLAKSFPYVRCQMLVSERFLRLARLIEKIPDFWVKTGEFPGLRVSGRKAPLADGASLIDD